VDVFTRFGGDEFVTWLPETDLTSAKAVARRLVDEIAAAKIPTPHELKKSGIKSGLF
jgi:PleD family two-component response regulator